MAPNHKQFEREEVELERQLAAGEITYQQFCKYMSELRADIRGAFEQDMHEAEQRVRDGWGY